MMDFAPIWLTLKLAFVTTFSLMIIGIPIAYGMSVWNSRFKPVVASLISMPLVLPPTVIGFYLLIAFSPNSSLGSFLQNNLGLELAFSFTGLVIASIIYSLPFMIHPIQSGLQALPPSWTETALLMGKSKWTILTQILLPNIKPAVITAIVLSFAHTIGEFGMVLMIGGNIPNKTKVASIALYDEVESMNYIAAHQYALTLFLLSFLILFLVYWKNGFYINRN